MFTQTDLMTLVNAGDDSLKVSLFLPTAPSGRETLQGRIVLKNALARVRAELDAREVDDSATDDLLAPAEAMVRDTDFWQHQSEGLAIFLAPDSPPRHFSVPIPLTEEVVVSEAFSVGPLLPLLSADGSFTVLTVTTNRVRLFEASRFTMDEVDDSGLLSSLQDSMGESDYENPLQASPVARPHTADFSISNAQVYGDSPAEWQDSQTREFASRVASALTAYQASHPRPTVLVSGAEYIGLLGSTDAVTDSVDVDPESLDDQKLHEVAYEKVQAVLDDGRARALDTFAMLRGGEDARAVVGSGLVAQASTEGRVDTLLYRHLSPTEASAEGGESDVEERRLLDSAVIETLRNGGTVYALDDSPVDDRVRAVLRY
ncbi:baeRF3 domain-containing protein [Planctomonas psychrotolerans]|uniref:baeRF3 domain-containing protein n=1 Tax=Planctomonas psychrotolerans TaxID=2528712 RepID=UPI001D0CF9C0|nr:hypothetical protein [Planctomonas psychrotolerans]